MKEQGGKGDKSETRSVHEMGLLGLLVESEIGTESRERTCMIISMQVLEELSDSEPRGPFRAKRESIGFLMFSSSRALLTIVQGALR